MRGEATRSSWAVRFRGRNFMAAYGQTARAFLMVIRHCNLVVPMIPTLGVVGFPPQPLTSMQLHWPNGTAYLHQMSQTCSPVFLAFRHRTSASWRLKRPSRPDISDFQKSARHDWTTRKFSVPG